MEGIVLKLDAAEFDKAVHGGLGLVRVLKEKGDLAVYVKPDATVGGKAMAVITFTVEMPDGGIARVQAVTTAALLEMVGGAIRGWKSGGHIQ
jgi:hypothetical protein